MMEILVAGARTVSGPRGALDEEALEALDLMRRAAKASS